MTYLAVKQKTVLNTTFNCNKEKQSDLLELLLTCGRLDLQDIADLLETPKQKLIDVITGKDFLKLLREYRVRCVLMLQYIAQTYEQYSHDEAKAFTNIKTKIAFAAEDLQDAEYISKLLGTKTIRVQSGSASSQQQGYSESRSYHYQAVPLLKPDDVMRLPVKQALIMRTGVAPVRASQFVWYKLMHLILI